MSARTPRAAAPIAAGVLAALAPTFACAPVEPGPDAGEGRGVLLVAIDGLRADHVGSFGYDRDTTPHLDRLAAEGVTFSNAVAAAPRALPSLASLLSGCDPNLARRGDWAPPDDRWDLPVRVPRLPVELLAAGYATAGYADRGRVNEANGFHVGFQTFPEFDTSFGERLEKVGIGPIAERFLAWLSNLPSDRSWFAFLEAGDLERTWFVRDPEYDTWFEPRPELGRVPPVSNEDPAFFAIPRERWRGGARPIGVYEARYDGTLRRVDAVLGELFERLRLAGRWEETTVCVVATHGIEFGDVALVLDSGMLARVDLHVPWILRPAAGAVFEPGRRFDGIASLVDVAPTLLDLQGIEPPPGMHGRSQADALVAGGRGARDVAFASCGLLGGWIAFDDRHAFEQMVPGSSAWDHLGEAWLGAEPSGRDLRPHERYYDYRDGPFPEPGEFPPFDAERARPLAAAGRIWFEHVGDARRVLHPPAIPSREPDPPDAARLIDAGYLPPERPR